MSAQFPDMIETCNACGQENRIPQTWPAGKMVVCGACKSRLDANDDADDDDSDDDDSNDDDDDNFDSDTCRSCGHTLGSNPTCDECRTYPRNG